ncbi:hypothetical protein EJB05_20343 [Eragrostis curvula]|uniref:BHLH domain-containing protein n=1 Tax=Eragrostis curvula TaxID=38414 RepID=A0A5J9V0I0_9POAL|nr:hypothetical protein EJB05_20343 [Eragrostis curvula]
MVRRRTRALRDIVPGGRGMDECTLLGETLDYAVSLKAQVDTMQLLLRALQAPKNPNSKRIYAVSWYCSADAAVSRGTYRMVIQIFHG